MKAIVFLKKELVEGFRTPKAMVLIIIFLFCGIMSPLSARYINEIIQSTGQLGDFKLPDPTWIDSFVQFYKNNQSLCFIALLLTFMNSVVGEKKSGTVVLMLSKGLSRSSFIYSKYFAAAFIFLAAYIVNVAVTLLYTSLLFDNFTPDKVISSMAVYALTGIFYLSVSMLSSVLATNATSAAILSIGGYFLASILEIIPVLKRVLPGKLMEISFDLIKGNGWMEGSLMNIIATVLLSAALLQVSVLIFRRQEL